MMYICKWIAIAAATSLFSIQSLAGGMPVVDAHEISKQLSDSVYLLNSIESLLGELGLEEGDIASIETMGRELQNLKEEINHYKGVSDDVDDLFEPNFTKSKILAQQVRSATRYLRKLKSVLSLAKAFSARPEAVNASLKVLKENREREKQRREASLKALEQAEKMNRARKVIESRRRLKARILKEKKIIYRMSEDGDVKPSFVSRSERSGRALW